MVELGPAVAQVGVGHGANIAGMALVFSHLEHDVGILVRGCKTRGYNKWPVVTVGRHSVARSSRAEGL